MSDDVMLIIFVLDAGGILRLHLIKLDNNLVLDPLSCLYLLDGLKKWLRVKEIRCAQASR